MDEQAYEPSLLDNARSVPSDLRAEWECQWLPDGRAIGHQMAPVGKYVHDLADEVERLTAQLEQAHKAINKAGALALQKASHNLIRQVLVEGILPTKDSEPVVPLHKCALCDKTFFSPEGRDHHEELCDGLVPDKDSGE